MSWHTWLLFIATEITFCLTPGPAVLFVVSQAPQYGGRHILSAAFFLLSAVGLGAVLLASHELFAMIRYVGAAYLIYLGLATIMGRGLVILRPDRIQPLRRPSVPPRPATALRTGDKPGGRSPADWGGSRVGDLHAALVFSSTGVLACIGLMAGRDGRGGQETPAYPCIPTAPVAFSTGTPCGGKP